MSILTKKPQIELQKHIYGYTSLKLSKESKSVLFPNGSYRLPNTVIRITFHFTDVVPWIELNEKRVPQPMQSIRGYQLSPFNLNTEHLLDVFTIEFTPYGFYNIFDIPCSELTQYPIELDSVLNKEYQVLLEGLGNRNTFSQRVEFMNSYFLIK